jgi:LemA protein
VALLVFLIILLVSVVIVGIAGVVMYNGLVKLRNKVESAWAQIDVQLKRRYDLIPNLVETVKGYAAHERQTLEAVIQARNMAMSAQGPAQQAQAENMITGALKSLFARSEAYPDLKANQSFLQLQEELTGTEGRIAYSRQFYNDTVQKYNTKIQTFPTVVLAGMFHFGPREYFEVEDAARDAVRVSFDTAPTVSTTPPAAPAAPAAPTPPADPAAPPTGPPTGPPPQ